MRSADPHMQRQPSAWKKRGHPGRCPRFSAAGGPVSVLSPDSAACDASTWRHRRSESDLQQQMPAISSRSCAARTAAGRTKSGSRTPRVRGWAVKKLPLHSPSTSGNGKATNRNGTAIHIYTSQDRSRPSSQPLPRANTRAAEGSPGPEQQAPPAVPAEHAAVEHRCLSHAQQTQQYTSRQGRGAPD